MVERRSGPLTALLTRYMEEQGLRSVEQLAEATGISRTTLFGLMGSREAGASLPSLPTLVQLAATLGRPTHELLYLLVPDAPGAGDDAPAPPSLAGALGGVGERLYGLLRGHGLELAQVPRRLGLGLEVFADPARLLGWLEQPATPGDGETRLEFLARVLGTGPAYLLGETSCSGRAPVISGRPLPAAGVEAVRRRQARRAGSGELTVYGSEQARVLVVCVQHVHDPALPITTEWPLVALRGEAPGEALAWLAALHLALAGPVTTPPRLAAAYHLVGEGELAALADGRLHPKLASTRPLDPALSEERRIGADTNGFAPATLYPQAQAVMSALQRADVPVPFTLQHLHVALNVPPRDP